MFKKLFTLVLFALLAVPLATQAQEVVEIGDGTNTARDIPIGTYYNYSFTEQLYTAEEIGMAGSITSISFNYASSTAKDLPIEVYMKNVDNEDLSSAIEISDDDIVFSGTLSVTEPGWATIELDSPFEYDGSSNLLIAINKDYLYYYSDYTWYCTSVSGMARKAENDNSGYTPTATLPTTSAVSNRPNIQIEITAGGEQGPTCTKVAPNSITITDITTTSATISWVIPEGQEGATYYIYQGEEELGSTDEDYFTIEDLEQATTYASGTFTIVTDCNNGADTKTTNIPAFSTACEAIVDFPWNEDFEDFNASSSGVKLDAPCWTNVHLEGSGTYFFETYSGTNGTNSTKQLRLHDMSSGTMTKLVLPEMELPGDNYLFSIDVYRNASGTSYPQEGIRIYASTDGEIEGATELAFISRNFTQTDDNLIPAEAASGWYTYEIPLGIDGPCRIIIRGESKYGSATYMDNFIVKEMPNCLKPTLPHVTEVSANSVTLAWTDNNGGGEYIVTDGEGEEVEVEDLTESGCTVVGLQSNTAYTFVVMADCGGEYSDAVSVSTRTACEAISELPWTEGFEDVPNGSNVMPYCWTKLNGGVGNYPYVQSNSYSTYSHSGNRCLYFYYSTYGTQPDEEIAVSREFSQDFDWSALRLRFYAKSSNATLVLGTMTDPNDATTFSEVTTFAVSGNAYSEDPITFTEFPSTDDRYLAFKVVNPSASLTLYVDDITIDFIPNCPDVTGVAATVDGLTATVEWNANESATGYVVELRQGDDVVSTMETEEATATFRELALGDYQAYVRANCGDELSPWSSAANIHIGYCMPNPTSRDGQGITNVAFGGMTNETHPSETPFYGDYSEMSGSVQASTTATIDITYATGSTTVYSYGTIIWVDWNNSLSFEDDEIVFTGMSAQGSGGVPEVLTATFDIPVTQTPGNYRMRIAGADSYFDSYVNNGTGNHDPCFTSTYAVAEDYTLVVTPAPSCLPVSELEVTDIQAESVSLTWVDQYNEGATYTVTYGDNSAVAEDNAITIEGLNPETEYTFSVVANCSETEASTAVEVSATTLASCAPVTQLTAVDVTGHNAVLQWSSNAQEYRIYRIFEQEGVDTAVQIGTTTELQYNFNNQLGSNLTYTYAVQAVCGDVETEMTTITITTGDACAAPTNFTVTLTPGDGTVATLSWTPGAEETQWSVCLDDNLDNAFMVSGEPLITLAGLTPEQTYTAKVSAFCSEFEGEFSPWSNTVTFTPTNSYSITVNDSTKTNDKVPVYGNWVDNISKSQFIIPAADLAAMQYGTITGLTFYAQADKNWGAAQFEVYMTETDATALSALEDYTAMTQVMSAGSLSIVDGKMVVTLDEPYMYMGGNLMIGVLQTVSGSYSSCNWYGVSATGASMGGYGNSVSQQNFLPKTTISYIPGEAPECNMVNNLTVGEVTAHTAEISWTAGGSETSWNVYLDEELVDNVTEAAYTFTGLLGSTEYTVSVAAVCAEESPMRNATFTTEDACAAPTDFTVTLTPGNGSVATFSWTPGGDETTWQICFDENTDQLFVAGENPVTIIDFTPEQTRTAKVRAICPDGYYSPWSSTITFTPTDAYIITVNDGTSTNEFVPIYGYYCDDITKSQFVIPAEDLAAMQYGTINKLTFYANEASIDWGDAQFEVYMTETDATTISALADYTTMTQVKSAGTLSVVDGMMEVILQEPYEYNGGNLMIGFLQTVSGTWVRSNWYGVSADGASMGGYGTSVAQKNFLPKTTIAYLPGEAPACPKPMQVAVNYEGGATAEVSWTSDAETFNILVNDVMYEGVENPYTLTDLSLATTYTIQVMAVCDEATSEWTNPVSFTTDLCMPEDMCELTFELIDSYGDSWNGAAIVVTDVETGSVLAELANENLDGTTGSGENELNVLTLAVCNGRELSFSWITGNYDNEASYTVKTANGVEIFSGSGAMSEDVNYTVDCDAVPEPEIDTTDVTACEEYLWEIADVLYTESGEYEFVDEDNNIIYILNLTILNGEETTVELPAGSTYDWNGQTYTATGVYEYTYMTEGECELTDVLYLTIEVDTTQGDTTVVEPTYYTVTLSVNNAVAGYVEGFGQVEEGTEVTISATPYDGYHFVYWSNGSTVNPYTFVVNGDVNMTAYFEQDVVEPTYYNVTLSVNNTEAGYVEGFGQVEAGTEHTITATPYNGYHFVYWSNGVAANPYTFTVDGDYSLMAYFEEDYVEPTYYTVTLLVPDSTTGSVRGAGQYEAGSEVTLYAVAADGYEFSSWGDGNTENPRTIVVEDNVELMAYFTEIYVPEVCVAPELTNLTVEGTNVVLDVTLAENNTEWSINYYGDGDSVAQSVYGLYENTYLLTDLNPNTMYTVWISAYCAEIGENSEDVSITFTTGDAAPAGSYTLILNSNDVSMGSVYGAGVYEEGTEVPIYAIPYPGFQFSHWSNNWADNPGSVTMTDNVVLTAYFEPVVCDPVYNTDTVEVYVYDTVEVEVPVYDTITNTVYDTITNTVYDTITNTVYDTITNTEYVEVPVHDTTYITQIDTVTNTEYVEVPVHDTTYITQIDTVTNTEYVEVPVHDTTYITQIDTVINTEYVEVPVHDTTYITQIDTVINTEYVEVPVHDTTIVTNTEYVYDTITNTVYDTIINTEYVEVPVHDTTYITQIDTVINTEYVEVPVHDTTIVTNTEYVYDTITNTEYVEVHDTTYIQVGDGEIVYVEVPVHDTTIVTLYDTIINTEYVEVPVHDTTIVTLIDTVINTEYVEVPVHDTTYIQVGDGQVVYVEVPVHDTTYVTVLDTIINTEYVEVPVHDTTIVTLTDTVINTEYVTVFDTIINTEYVEVPVHDTTIVTLIDTVINTEYVTVNDTIEVEVPVYVTDTVTVTETITDTVTVTETITDTITVVETDTVYFDTLYIYDTITITVHDTIYIHDSVGIDGVTEGYDVKLYQRGGYVVVEGAENQTIYIYDAVGRVVATRRADDNEATFEVPTSGVYLVKVGNAKARRIVVVR